MLCLGKCGAGRLCSALLGDLPAGSEAEMSLARNRRLCMQAKPPGVQKHAPCNRVCWLNTKSDIVKSKITKVRNWIHQFFFSHNEWKYSWWVSFLSLLVVFFLLCVDEISIFHPNNSPGHWSAALKLVLTTIKSAQWICVPASIKHWGAFSWPSLSNCSIHLFEKRESENGREKRCL